MTAPDVSIVIVNLNTRNLLRDCLIALAANAQEMTETIVVDNGSTDGSVEMLAAEFPGVGVIANASNAGFAPANNQGLARASGRYALLLNSDTRVAADALINLVAFMDAHPQAGACGPQLRNADGTLQPSGRCFPTLASTLGELLPAPEHWRRKLRGDLETRDYDQVYPVDELSGAALCVRRDALEQIGFLDEDFFFLGEDIDLCWRLKSAGWLVFYVPSARVMHYWGGSRNKTRSYRISLLSQRSYYLLFRKHRTKTQARALKVVLVSLTAMKLIKWLVRFLIRLDTQQTRQVIRQHLAELAWLARN
jgi:GT2 family glycosyltransferase